jgi:formate hydrogenlyase transcriptional activator
MAQHAGVLDDGKRLDAIQHFDILDTSPEPSFDRLAKLAAQICAAPYAAITFVDGPRHFFKAKIGFTDGEASDMPGFSSQALLQSDIFVVPDAAKDKRFAANPLVTGSAQVRFYAGATLTTADGHALGTLSVLDRAPRQLTKEQADALRVLANEVMSELELRRTRKDPPLGRLTQDAALSARYKADEFLRSLVEGTINSTGVDFLRELVRQVAAALGIRYAYVGLLLPQARIRTLAFWKGDGYLDPFEFSLEGTPCKKVIEGSVCHHAQNVQQLFPADRGLGRLGVKGYLAVPLKDPNNTVIGHLVAMDIKTMALSEEEIIVFKLFGERAGVEISRQVMENSLKKREAMLRMVIEGTASELGGEFFHSLVKHLAAALGVKYAFVSEFCPDKANVRTLAFWAGDRFEDNFEYALIHTPCEKVLAGEMYHCTDGVADRFPGNKQDLDELEVASYLAIPVTNSSGQVLGHLAAMDTKPMPLDEFDLSVFKIFGVRAGAELERTYLEETLKDSEERLADLFDEAPIAYVNEGLDSKFIRANRTAMKALGITPDQVEGTYGKNFAHDTPDAQRRMQQAFEAIGRGADTSGVVLELRRRDNSKPLWVQWWSRPHPSGTYTRTMFLDITDRVLLEQEKERLEAHNLYLQEEIKVSHNFEELIGSSASLKKVLSNVERVAPTESAVLITGETGTGKELIARAIHNLSLRKDKPLVKVNCAAIPSGLIESELFGHEKGAFTGALARRIGRFELADKGTIFLDEIGDMPLDLQAKLLRVLQEGEFERVGGNQTIKVTVRVIAATNRDLARLSESGTYRADLYYRLNVFPIHLPPLREREGDVRPLVEYFVQKYAAVQGKQIQRIPEQVWATLQQYRWPGNIRELEHVIERAVILTDGPELAMVDWLASTGKMPEGGPLPTLEALEREHIIRTLENSNWRVSGDKGAAAALGLKPTTLEARMKKLGIKRSDKP